MTLNDIADSLINRLKTFKIVVHRYNAYSTNSIYLKLDYGALNSIRISDHKGKRHLHYKYNIQKDGVDHIGWHKDNNIWRYYTTPSKKNIDNLINIIIEDRFTKQTMGNYNRLLEKYKSQRADVGFWTKAERVC